MTTYNIVKVDWENANNLIPIVLVSKKERNDIGCDVCGGVAVKKDATRIVSLVQVQFREFVGQEKVATVNKFLADKLGVSVGDSVEIDNAVTETEWAAFQTQLPRIDPLATLMRALAPDMRMGRPRDLTPRDTPRDPTDGHE